MRVKLSVSVFLIGIILAVFWQTGCHEFLSYDDNVYVCDNTSIRNGITWDGIRWSFLQVHAGNWHPLTWISHMVDCQLFGPNPTGHHLVSVVLHAANAVLLFLFLAGVTGALWRSAFVASLFALHPLHVESVAWIAERKDMLSMLFWMTTLLLYVLYVQQRTNFRYAMTLGAFAVGLMTKPMLVTLPFVFLLLDYWPLRRLKVTTQPIDGAAVSDMPTTGFGHLCMEKLPFLVLSALSSIVTVYAQQQGGAVSSLQALPFLNRVTNALVAYRDYIAKTFWPENLAIIYSLPDDLVIWPAGISATLLALITLLVAKEAQRRPYLVVGWLWFLGTLVPVIGLLQVGRQTMADRYTYIPLIGLFIMVTWGVSDLTVRIPFRRTVLGVAAGVSLVALTAITWRQLSYWQNSFTLFGHACKVVPANFVAHFALGNALAEEGRYPEAAAQLSEALRIAPYFHDAHYSLGKVYTRMGNPYLARNHFMEVLRLDPSHEKAQRALEALTPSIKGVGPRSE